MSYLEFHLVFVLPPIAALAWSLRGDWPGRHPRARLFLGLIAAIALAYTTPWDNYLVWRGVWSYGADRVLGTIGYVPVEEYLFFLLQPLLAGLWLYRVIGRAGGPGEGDPGVRRGGPVRLAGAAVYFALALAGALLLRSAAGTYLGLILVWAAPVLGLQWAFAGAEIWRRRRIWLLGVAAPTLYLWVADALAIRLGIWGISTDLSTGALVLGLPVEEAVFFLVTDLLVVQGLMLFLWPPRRSATPAVGGRPSAVGSGRPTADSR